MNRKRLIIYCLMILVPLLFFMVLLAFISFPLMLAALLVLIVLLGLLKRHKPELWETLFKGKRDSDNIMIEHFPPDPNYPKHPKAYLMLISVNASNQHCITMDNSTFTIGREKSCNYVLDDPMVSRRHLTIEYNENDNMCYVQDNESANGSYLNSSRLKMNHPLPLKQGDILQIANTVFTVEYVHF